MIKWRWSGIFKIFSIYSPNCWANI